MILEKFKLEGQTGIVTGAGQGLGKAFATAFAEAGANVVVADINDLTGEQAAKDLAELGVETMFVETDVSSIHSCEEMAKKVFDKFGRIDFLMNNAGICQHNPPWKSMKLNGEKSLMSI